MANPAGPSETILDEITPRALKFLGAISTNAYIRAILTKRGYTEVIHNNGWSLLLRASGYRRPTGTVRSAPEATAAIATIDAWDEPNFRVARATFAVEFPDQLAFVFQDLDPQTGAGAVVSVTTFLDRLDELESGKDRKATRKVDQAALVRLAERGIDESERKRLRALLAVALSSPPSDDGAPSVIPDPKGASELRDAKVALYNFFAEWSEIARADIKRRDYLIQLGMANRKVGKKNKKEEAEDKGGSK